MIPTRIHAKLIGGIWVKNNTIVITPTSIATAIMLGIVSLRSSFLWSRFLRCGEDDGTNEYIQIP
jgi:hypothetical protein